VYELKQSIATSDRPLTLICSLHSELKLCKIAPGWATKQSTIRCQCRGIEEFCMIKPTTQTMVVGPYHLVQSSLSSHHISQDEWYAQANSFNGRRHVQLKEYDQVHRIYILATPISTPIPLDLEQDNLWICCMAMSHTWGMIKSQMSQVCSLQSDFLF